MPPFHFDSVPLLPKGTLRRGPGKRFQSKGHKEARDLAIAANQETFISGIPCKFGHTTERTTLKNECVECLTLRKAKWSKDNKEHVRFLRVEQMYGVSQDEWESKFLAQGNCCAICKSLTTGTKRGWHTDHSKLTGKFRGVLCHHCNLLLGNCKDGIETLKAAIEYLIAA